MFQNLGCFVIYFGRILVEKLEVGVWMTGEYHTLLVLIRLRNSWCRMIWTLFVVPIRYFIFPASFSLCSFFVWLIAWTLRVHLLPFFFPLQVVEDGYEFFADRQLVTIFSAPNYCGEFDNAGAMMSVDESLMCSFQILKPLERKTRFLWI